MRLTQIKASSKGFTLVELIVVITILAILGTIAFISFGSQSSAARDSKRKTDLSNIASKMNVAMANGTTYLGLVSSNSAQQVASISLGGTGGTVGTDYDAGTVNFNVLGVNPEDFKDADGTNTYKIGATSLGGGAFQLAAKLENDSSGNQGANALIVGNYTARLDSTTGTLENTSGNTAKLPNPMVGFIKKGDWVIITGVNGGAAVQVTSVSSDLTTITTSVAPANADIKLAVSESAGLVKSTGTNPVTNESTSDLPY